MKSLNITVQNIITTGHRRSANALKNIGVW